MATGELGLRWPGSRKNGCNGPLPDHRRVGRDLAGDRDPYEVVLNVMAADARSHRRPYPGHGRRGSGTTSSMASRRSL